MLKEMIIGWGMRLIEIKRINGHPQAARELAELNAEMLLWILQLKCDNEPPEVMREIFELHYKRRGEKSTREVDDI